MVYKLVLGMCEERTARYLHSEWDENTNSLYVRNVYHPIYSNMVVQLTATEPLTGFGLESPNRKRLGLSVTVPANGERQMAFVISSFDRSEGGTPLAAPTIEGINAEFERVREFWDEKLSCIQWCYIPRKS